MSSMGSPNQNSYVGLARSCAVVVLFLHATSLARAETNNANISVEIIITYKPIEPMTIMSSTMVSTPRKRAALDDAAMGFYNKWALRRLLPDVYYVFYPSPLPLPSSNDDAAIPCADLLSAFGEPETECIDGLLVVIMEGELGSRFHIAGLMY
jgi:hypothetical protein